VCGFASRGEDWGVRRYLKIEMGGNKSGLCSCVYMCVHMIDVCNMLFIHISVCFFFFSLVICIGIEYSFVFMNNDYTTARPRRGCVCVCVGGVCISQNTKIFFLLPFLSEGCLCLLSSPCLTQWARVAQLLIPSASPPLTSTLPTASLIYPLPSVCCVCYVCHVVLCRVVLWM
jgi:hypothetical protein